MKKLIAGAALVVLGLSMSVSADVSITAKEQMHAANRAANQAERAAKRAHQHRASARTGRRALDTGSASLIDGSGLKYFINTEISNTTASSASAAMSDASYTHAVAASTALGGTSSTTLTGMFDGYNGACINVGGTATMPCLTSNSAWLFYNQTDTEPQVDPSCGGQQLVFPSLTLGGLQVSRKIYVPSTDSFARWLNIFTNPTGAPITIKFGTSNDLGAGTNTSVVTSSNGTATVNPATTWVTTFRNFSGNSSSEPRIGHVLQSVGAPVGLTDISFVSGDRNPFWSYVFTIPPGATEIIMNFVTGQPSKAAAATQAARLVTLPDVAVACMSVSDKAAVVNFAGAGIGPGAAGPVPALSRTGLAALAIALAIAAAFALRKSPL